MTPQRRADTVIGLLVEAGWAPWIKSGDVPINTVFPLDETSTRYQRPNDTDDPDAAAMVDEINGSRRLRAFWIPWAGSAGGFRTNSRCSIGAVLAPAGSLVQNVSRIRVPWFQRPVLRIQLGPGRNVTLTILLVHMISGMTWNAQQEMAYLMSSMSSLIPEGTAGLIVGDMNVDLLSTSWAPPANSSWTLLHNGKATCGGGSGNPSELDYALLWDPHRVLKDASCKVLDMYGQGNNTSDHSVIAYVLGSG